MILRNGRLFLAGAILVSGVLVSGCVATTSQHVLDSGGQSQLEQRNYQTRAFDTTDRDQVLRAVIATLQDIGFVIDRADAMLGSVSATKWDGYQLRITVSVRPRGEQMAVRANAQYNLTPVTDPKPYQDFFNALSQSLFLQAHEVD